MSSDRVNILIGIGQLVFALLVFLGMDAAWFRRMIPIDRDRLILIFLMGGFAFSGYGLYRTFTTQAVRPENVEPLVRAWMDAFSFGVKKLPDSQSYFAYEVVLQNNVPLGIARTKDHPHYLTLFAKVSISDEHKAVLQKYSAIEWEKFALKLRLEAAKNRIATNFETPLTFPIQKRLPITPGLTEADLLDAIAEINYAAIVVRDTITLLLDPKFTQPSSIPDKGASPP